MKRFCFLLTLVCLLSGCNVNEQAEFVKTTATYPPAASNMFTLPEGYYFADETTASIVRAEDSQIIGGILEMGLDPDCLEGKDNEAVHRYLNSLGYICEYISMNADGHKSVRHYITDQDSEERRETSRCLFPKDGDCYDLWFDNASVTEEEKTLIRVAIIGQ